MDQGDINQIKNQFKDEWLLFEVQETDELKNPVRGKLLAHSPSRAAIYEFLGKNPCPHFYIVYTGDRPRKGMVSVL